ncbi:hypothetical protein AAVH_10677 [Aphelenchoides avenae]|nr:hypothetical protein AAVH_10677 [Aphelenchus avenae]
MEIGTPITIRSVKAGGMGSGTSDNTKVDKRCIENLQQLEDYLFCFAGGQDNTGCCRAAGVTTQACLDLCAGTLPDEGMNSRAFTDGRLEV